MDERVIGGMIYIENVVLFLGPGIDLRPSEHGGGGSSTIENIVLSSLGWSDGSTAWVERTGYIQHIPSFYKS